jgi:hypothetical protein
MGKPCPKKPRKVDQSDDQLMTVFYRLFKAMPNGEEEVFEHSVSASPQTFLSQLRDMIKLQQAPAFDDVPSGRFTFYADAVARENNISLDPFSTMEENFEGMSWFIIVARAAPASAFMTVVPATNVIGKLEANDATPTWFQPNRKPDSQRIGDILPEVVTNGELHMYFVNRDESMKNLLKVHLDIHKRRAQSKANTGPEIKIPLMDSLFGMGKTTFAWNYLALVTRFVENVGQYRHGEGFSEPCLSRIQRALYPDEEEPATRCETDGYIGSLLSELLSARTLYIDCSIAPLFEISSREHSLMMGVRKGLERWGIDVPGEVKWDDCINTIQRQPVFIIFDEIGEAFNVTGVDLIKQRDAFIDFVSQYCLRLSRSTGVHYLLCGKAPFLWNVGMRPEEETAELTRSPGTFSRINLNPIRQEYIGVILEKTYVRGKRLDGALMAKCPELTLERIIEKLYVQTGGHPRCLHKSTLSEDPVNLDNLSLRLLDDVKHALECFPEGIRHLFEMRHGSIDLTKIFKNHGESSATFEYLATRIHAGYGLTLKATQLFLPPAVEGFLMRQFLPFAAYVRDLEKQIKKRYIDKGRVFEDLMLKWIEATFSAENKTVGEILGDFCPSDSILFGRSIQVDPTKVVEGPRILQGKKNSQSERTISMVDFAKQLRVFLETSSVHVYYPYRLSHSPDILVIPRNSVDVVVGFQAKCYESGVADVDQCLSEGEKLYVILEHVRAAKKNKKKVTGVLLMCSTSTYTQRDFIPLTNMTSAYVWSHGKLAAKKWVDFEIVIVNLSTRAMRNKFFGLALGQASVGDDIGGIIEHIIRYR